MFGLSLLVGAGLLGALPALALAGGAPAAGGIYDFTVKTIDGKEIPLSAYRGKVLLIVNVASECGHTPQYKDLEALYRKYRDRGFVVLGFPANNFGGQEPGTDAEIMEFCSTTYDVTFPMFSKISVAGEDQHPLYRFITSGDQDPAVAGEVKWNFQKYLVGRDGRLMAKYLSRVKPMSGELTGAVEKALAAPAK
jgi:glutathione peroxidase